MPKSKKFIDRKHSVTFHLVHRSQQDPLVADENAPQRVLLPVATAGKTKGDLKKQKEEQQKYGIMFDDDYNYLQHLRERTGGQTEWEQVENTSNLKLPSSVFASTVEEDVGLLNKAAPYSGLRLDLDPDVVAAMDEDFNYELPENQLEDDFIALANADHSRSDSEPDYGSAADSDFDYDSEANDDVASLTGPQFTFNDEETRSRFTDYSMSSSVMRRNEQLSLLDERFEKMYQSYDADGVGALDCDEIEGHVDIHSSDLLLQCAEEFERDMKLERLEKDGLNAKCRQYIENDSNSLDEEHLIEIPNNPKEKWDCESILSTYSNIYNHPKLISEPKNTPRIQINPRTGVPINVIGSNKLTKKAISQFNVENNMNVDSGPKSVCAKSVISTLSTLSIRPKDETPEERKERKIQLKDYRKLRRIEKKANTEAFKDEAKRQVKITINNRNNIQGNRLL